MEFDFLKKAAAVTAALILLGGLLWFLIYHASGGFTPKAEILPARFGTYDASLDGEAWIFREETPLYRNQNGSIGYLVDNGGKVGIDQEIAKVYFNSNSNQILSRITAIDKSLKLLEAGSLTGGASVLGVDTLDRQIGEAMQIIREEVDAGQPGQALLSAQELLAQLNKRRILTAETPDYEDEIADLRRERQGLVASLGSPVQTVTAPASGYFYKSVDGYETIFTMGNMENLTVESFEALKKSEKQDYGEKCIGKLVYQYDWYFACSTDVRRITDYSVGQSYDVRFPYSGDVTLSAELTGVLTQRDTEGAVLLFHATRMPEGFSFRRCQKVRILTGTYAGLKVPADAVRVADGVTGVYILYGSTVYFRSIEPVGEAEGYIYARSDFEGVSAYADDEDPANDVFYKPLREYDEIVVSAVGLYDGKVLK